MRTYRSFVDNAMVIVIAVVVTAFCVWSFDKKHSVYFSLVILASIVLTVGQLRRRIVLDERGISNRGMWGTRFIPWSEITDCGSYYRPGDPGEDGEGAHHMLIVNTRSDEPLRVRYSGYSRQHVARLRYDIQAELQQRSGPGLQR